LLLNRKNMKIKKIFLATISSIILLFSSFNQALAKALVECGGKNQPACKLIDIFKVFKNILEFVWFSIIPPIAILMLIIGGIMFITSSGNPDALKKSKALLTSIVIGLIIIYGAWLVINLFFTIIGVESWTGLKDGWFQIKN
ncbi:MAG: TrbC/VirB2 family protein, partial [Patescibacteria group bacterium]|nr:TrbC/VirB2 family protein [Patescibacteria group bacterium]